LFFLKGDTVVGVELDAPGNPVAGERTVLAAPRLDDFQISDSRC
jgi:hypothetical protein